jgi:choline dehydrogenase
LSRRIRAGDAGHRRAGDISGGLEEGFGRPDLNIVAGRRQSAVDAYLAPAASRGNLRVVTGALVHRVLVNQDRCDGVEYSAGGELVRAGCTGEVVLAAGAIGSAQLLRSGIGPAAALRPHGIQAVADLPGVGENLQDHPGVSLVYAPGQPLPAARFNRAEVLGLLRSGPDVGYPDLQIGFSEIPVPSPGDSGPQAILVLLTSLMQPFSRGTVRLASASPDAAPVVAPRYLTDSLDLDAIVRGLWTGQDIPLARALKPWLAREIAPGLDAGDDAAARAYATAAVLSCNHPVGTCRIGTDDMAVVDLELRVHGVSGLRGADASVMPSIDSANTNATVYAIAERAAELMRLAHGR